MVKGLLIEYNKSYILHRLYVSCMKVSFKHAISGIIWTLKNQQNFRIHLVISLAVLCLSFFLKVSKTETLLLVFAIVIGLTSEMINTAVEEVTNLITIKWAKQAKIAKDVSAGMMLLTAIGAAIVGLSIFLPYIFRIKP